MTSAPAETVLLVAVCAGPRCRGLRSLRDSSTVAGTTADLVREAVRQRPHAVLVSTGCQGPCHAGCVAAVGWAVTGSGQFHWSGRPVGLGMLDLPPRAIALAEWISGSAPDLTTLPQPLSRVDAS